MSQKQPLLSFTVLDGSNTAGRVRASLRSGITAVDAMIGGDGFRSLLSPLSGAVFVQQSVSYRVLIDDYVQPATSVSAGIVGVLVFTTTDPNQFAMIDIPAISPDCVLSTGDNAGLVLDTSNAALAGFIDTITTGMWCNYLGYDIVDLAATIVDTRNL